MDKQVRTTTHREVVLHRSASVLWVRRRGLMRLLIGSQQVNYRKLHWQTAELICRTGKDTLAITAQDRNNRCWCFIRSDRRATDVSRRSFICLYGYRRLTFIHFSWADFSVQQTNQFPGSRLQSKDNIRPQLTVKKLWESLRVSIDGDGQNPPITATPHRASDSWLVWSSLKNIRMQFISKMWMEAFIFYKPQTYKWSSGDRPMYTYKLFQIKAVLLSFQFIKESWKTNVW